MSSNLDIGAVSEKGNNKCALKLLGIDLGNLRDEEILEFISNYVMPSAIEALFYDSFNSFYVLHLIDIKSTCLIIGKTLQMSDYRVRFLPLFDCFVIRNVYMSVTNSDIRNIFSMFGNVFEVTNHHVLPNSSKFFHVLSGTREITFLLPGEDIDVQIPVTVAHPPFTFHVHQLCLACQTQGHSILNCPNREDRVIEDSPLPTITQSVSNHRDRWNEDSLVIKQELLLTISEEDPVKENTSEVDFGKASLTTSEQLKNLSIHYSERKKLEEGKRPEVEIVTLDENPSVNEEINQAPKAPEEKNVPESGPSRIFFQVTPLLEKYLLKVHGVLHPDEMVELLQIDARKKRQVISFVSNITSDFKLVLTQLRKTLRKYLRDEHFNTTEFKCKRKLLSLIKVLNDFKNLY